MAAAARCSLSLTVGQVAIDGDGAAGLGATLADLKPAPIGAALKQRFARVAMLGEPLAKPALTPALGVVRSDRAPTAPRMISS